MVRLRCPGEQRAGHQSQAAAEQRRTKAHRRLHVERVRHRALGGEQIDSGRRPRPQVGVRQPPGRVLRLEEQHLVEEDHSRLEVAVELELGRGVVERVLVAAGVSRFQLALHAPTREQSPPGRAELRDLRLHRAQIRRVRGVAQDRRALGLQRDRAAQPLARK